MTDGSFSADISLPSESFLGEMSTALEDHAKLLIVSVTSTARASMLALLASKDPGPTLARTEEATVARNTRERNMLNPSPVQRPGRVLGINNHVHLELIYRLHVENKQTRIPNRSPCASALVRRSRRLPRLNPLPRRKYGRYLTMLSKFRSQGALDASGSEKSRRPLRSILELLSEQCS
jgi:hypothetical protein